MKVLLLEDEDAIREVEAAYLKRAGFEVAEFTDSIAALQAASSQAFDLFLIDINLPVLSGLEVCRRLRPLTLAPIMLVTAKNADLDELAGLESGADDYLRKPFNPDVLVARANALLRRHGDRPLLFGDLSIEPATQTVSMSQMTVGLTATQFRILYLLASAPGRVYSRSEIVDFAYGDPFDVAVLERAVDGHIKRMRRLLEAGPSLPRYLHTSVGRGYYFKEAHA